MWSLACVCAEMFLGLPLFPGVSQHNQLFRIVEMLGLPPDFLIEGKNGKKYFTVVEKGDSPGGSKDVPIIENSPQSVCVGSAGISAAPAHPSSTCSGAAGAGGSSSSSSSSSAVASGSKFRIKTAEEYAAETNTQVPVLRKYLRYSRLDEVIMRCPLAQKARMTPEQKNVETVRRRCFLDFLQGLFRLNPFERWTARQALSHPFIQNTKFTGPFVPPPDMKINERKLNFMVLTQRKPPPSSFEAPNLSAGVRAPSNFSSHAGMPSGNSAQFTPLQLAHRRMSDPGIDHGGGSGGFQGSKSGGPQLLKRGSPAHLKADAARISPVVEHSPNAVESAVPFSREDSDEMTARSSSDEIPVSRSSEVTPSLQQTAHVTQPVHVQSQPVGVAGKTNVVESAGVGSAESLLTPQMRPENLAAQAIMRAKAREGQVSQLGPQLHAAVQYQQQQQAPTHAQSYQGGGGGGQSQTQRFMQQVAQQQRQRSIFPPQQPNNKPMYEQSLYRHPAQSGSAGNFTLQHPYGPQGETYSQPQLPQMGVSPQNSAAMQMSMSGMPGSSLGASYGNYSTVGSMQDGSSVIMTDFGLALMRPDMDEQRRLLSQTSMQGPYWQQQQPYGSPQNSTYSHPMGGLMGGEPVQRHAVAMSYGYGPNMMQLAAAANAFPYGGSCGGVGHHAGHHPSGQPHQQHQHQHPQQQAGSFDSKTMHARRRNPPAYDHHSAQYPPLQHHMHHAPILAGSPQQHYLAQQGAICLLIIAMI